MVKKYYQGSKDRKDEARGMRKHQEGHMHHHDSQDRHRAFVTGHDPGVGRMDHSGMPKETVMSSYPPNRTRHGGYLDDSMAEIDAIQVDSDHQVEKNLSYQK